MGTRADFYMGRGADAEWLGSVAWDGYPDGFDTALLACREAMDWRRKVRAVLEDRDDGTLPEMGWPWPWETSHTTDYAYAYDEGKVWGSCFGNEWWPATDEPDSWDEEGEVEIERPTMPPDAFPDMTARKNVQLGGQRSGLMVISAQTPASSEEES